MLSNLVGDTGNLHGSRRDRFYNFGHSNGACKALVKFELLYSFLFWGVGEKNDWAKPFAEMKEPRTKLSNEWIGAQRLVRFLWRLIRSLEACVPLVLRQGDSGRFAVDASRRDAEKQEGWHCMDGFEAVFMRGLAMLPAASYKCICRTSRHRIVICA